MCYSLPFDCCDFTLDNQQEAPFLFDISWNHSKILVLVRVSFMTPRKKREQPQISVPHKHTQNQPYLVNIETVVKTIQIIMVSITNHRMNRQLFTIKPIRKSFIPVGLNSVLLVHIHHKTSPIELNA